MGTSIIRFLCDKHLKLQTFCYSYSGCRVFPSQIQV